MEEKKREICERIFNLALETITCIEKASSLHDVKEKYYYAVGKHQDLLPKWKSLCLELAGISEDEFSRFVLQKAIEPYKKELSKVLKKAGQ